MVKKFAIKPWMIIVASVVVIGGVALFFVLNKGDDNSTPTDKSNESVKKSIVTEKEMVSLLCESVEFTSKEQEKQAREELKKEFGGLN